MGLFLSQQYQPVSWLRALAPTLPSASTIFPKVSSYLPLLWFISQFVQILGLGKGVLLIRPSSGASIILYLNICFTEEKWKHGEEASLKAMKVCSQMHMGFKSWQNLPYKAFKLSFSFLKCKMGLISTFSGLCENRENVFKVPGTQQAANEWSAATITATVTTTTTIISRE